MFKLKHSRCILDSRATFLKSMISSTKSFASSSNVLIETQDLETLIKEQPDNLSIFNATYALPNLDPRAEHIKSRITTSIFYDFNEFSNKDSQYSYMVPSE